VVENRCVGRQGGTLTVTESTVVLQEVRSTVVRIVCLVDFLLAGLLITTVLTVLIIKKSRQYCMH